MSESKRFIDVSHVVHDGLVTYPGMQAPAMRDYLSREASRARYAPGTEFHIGAIDMIANTGTYVDVPSHRFADGADLSQVALDSLADLEVVLLHVPVAEGRAIGAERFAQLDVRGRAVLVHTGWDAHWETPAYAIGHPYITRGGAEALVRGGVRFVGIDTFNIDDIDNGTRPAHTTLLAVGIPICEHMTNLAAVPASGGRLFAVPVKVAGMGTFPVRAFVLAS